MTSPNAAASAITAACGCAPLPGDLPEALLDVTVDIQEIAPPLSAFGVGFERGAWRAAALAEHVVEWVLDFALRPGEREPLERGRGVRTMKRAMRATFGNGRDRGMPGEILLHAICRQFYGSDTVINKVYFKTADNDTYKGFDAVHYVHTSNDELELWLGEAKFYKDVTKAIKAVHEDIDEHFKSEYLKGEFAIISDKIDKDHPHAASLRKLLDPTTSLDEVFDRLVVPVFVMYNSKATANHRRMSEEYRDDLASEAKQAWLKFKNGLDADLPVEIRLFLLPMADKAALKEALDEELLGWL